MSRPRFVLTPQARADLLEIWNYIEDSPENAALREYRPAPTGDVGQHAG